MPNTCPGGPNSTSIGQCRQQHRPALPNIDQHAPSWANTGHSLTSIDQLWPNLAIPWPAPDALLDSARPPADGAGVRRLEVLPTPLPRFEITLLVRHSGVRVAVRRARVVSGTSGCEMLRALGVFVSGSRMPDRLVVLDTCPGTRQAEVAQPRPFLSFQDRCDLARRPPLLDSRTDTNTRHRRPDLTSEKYHEIAPRCAGRRARAAAVLRQCSKLSARVICRRVAQTGRWILPKRCLVREHLTQLGQVWPNWSCSDKLGRFGSKLVSNRPSSGKIHLLVHALPPEIASGSVCRAVSQQCSSRRGAIWQVCFRQ